MTTSTPKISIIVPVYNTEKYLAQCIESILNQSMSDFELLLIDDGSKDSSGLICDRYAIQDKRIQVFHQTNQGVSTARNYGIDTAQSEWLCFIDSDDYIGPNYLAAFFDCSVLSEDCLNMQGWKLISDIDGKIMKSYSYPDLFVEKHQMKEIFCHYNFLSNSRPAEKLFNKKLLGRISLRFRTDLPVREDAMFVYTYRMHISSVKLISTTEYYYRQAFRRNTLSHKNHPHPVFLTIREELPPLIQKTLGKWELSDTLQGNNIVSYYKHKTCLSILKSLYAYPVPAQERRKVLKVIFNDKAYFDDPCFQTEPLLRLFKNLYHICPIRLYDTLCFIPFHIYYKYVKKMK